MTFSGEQWADDFSIQSYYRIDECPAYVGPELWSDADPTTYDPATPHTVANMVLGGSLTEWNSLINTAEGRTLLERLRFI